MDLSKLSQQELASLFEAGCFFIINHIPPGTQFGIDGSHWLTGSLFQGIKLIPPGFHIITITPTTTSSSSSQQQQQQQQQQPTSHLNPSSTKELIHSAGTIGYQLKKGLIRFFKPQEKLIRYYDPTAEDFKSHHDPSIEHTITSLDYIKSIDSQLAPYPMKDYDRWKTLTNYITLDHVSSMIGFNHQEDSLLDSLITNHLNLSKHPPPPLSNNLTHRTQWGKPRKLSPDHDSSKSELTHQPTTHWPFIDLNRSWPKDAIGPQLTKWSRDKSWLFNHLMHHQFKNDPKEVLGLLQLSFITFIEIQSIQSFEFYQSLMSVIIKSNLAELVNLNQPNQDENDKASSSTIPIRIEAEKIDYLQMNVDIIKVFSAQMKFLKPNFFSESMEDFQIENWFFSVIDRFRKNLNFIQGFLIKESKDTKRDASADEGREQKETEGERRNAELRKSLEGVDWIGVQAACKRFDWNVKDLAVPMPQLLAALDRPPSLESLLAEHEDSDDSSDELTDEEDEEFKPVLVFDTPSTHS